MPLAPSVEKSEVRVRVEWELVVEARIHGECRAERYEERVPVGSGPRNGFGAQIAGGARPVLYDKSLPETCRQFVREGARQEIERDASKPGHDDLDRPLRIRLRRRTPPGNRPQHAAAPAVMKCRLAIIILPPLGRAMRLGRLMTATCPFSP